MSKTALLALAAIGLLIGVVAAAAIQQYIISTQGTIIEITLSKTWASTDEEVTLIDWGACENGTEYYLSPINITNLSNVPVTLTLTSSNLSPSIITLSLTWNYTDTNIAVNDYVIVELYQTITATGPYTYDTIITGVEVE